MTIIAREVAFLTPDARIDTSGPDAPNSWPAGNKPQRPGDGGTDTNGSDGTAGIAGLPGGDAGNVRIYATRIKGKLDILAQGGKGERGQDGGDGSNGGFRSRPPAEPGNDCVGLHGERGTSGGNGGLPGAAGRSGNGGNVDVYLSTSVDVLQPSSVVLSLKGGSAADLAVGGQPGQGGPPASPRLARLSLTRASCPTGRPGVRGPDGSPAPAQHPSVPGTDGLFCGKPANTPAPPCYPLTDSALLRNALPSSFGIFCRQRKGFISTTTRGTRGTTFGLGFNDGSTSRPGEGGVNQNGEDTHKSAPFYARIHYGLCRRFFCRPQS